MTSISERIKELDMTKRLVIKDALLSNENSTILNMTYKDIETHKNTICNELQFDAENQQLLLEKLAKYRYVNELNDFVVGNYIRWINLLKYEENPHTVKLLQRGGVILDIEVCEDDVAIKCRLPYSHKTRVTTLKGSRNIFFQRISATEHILLAAIDYINK